VCLVAAPATLGASTPPARALALAGSVTLSATAPAYAPPARGLTLAGPVTLRSVRHARPGYSGAG
jgi:hypothetical protein